MDNNKNPGIIHANMSIIISTIGNLSEFSNIRSDWNRIFNLDAQAAIFLSWPWLRGWLEVTPFSWMILAAKKASNGYPVAFLPLAIRKIISGTGKEKTTIIQMAGDPQADYTGFLCIPGYEKRALAAFGKQLKAMNTWNRIEFSDVKDNRLDYFLQHFGRDKYSIEARDGTCCPILPLVSSWEEYSGKLLSGGTRRSLARKMRQLKSLPGFKITTLDSNDKGQQINALLELWEMRWGDGSKDMPHQFRVLHKQCADSGILWLDVMWERNIPIAALSAFLDNKHKAFRFYICGFNKQYSKFSPGKLIVLHAIHQAIKMKYMFFDFMRGAEPYKYSFGAQDRFNRDLSIRQKESIMMSLLKQNHSKTRGNGGIPTAASLKHDGRMTETRRLMKIQSSFSKKQVDYYTMLQQIFGDDLAGRFSDGPQLIEKFPGPRHYYFPNVILTTYFTSHYDPQTHKHEEGDNIEYIYPWYASMRRLGEHGIIFHDKLSKTFIKRYETDRIKFIRCRLTNRSMNDERFMIYFQFLLSNPYSKIFMTDGADVIVNRSAFPLVSGRYSNSLFVGRDRYNLNGHSSFMADQIKDYQYLTGNTPDDYFVNCPMYNAGIIGGSYPTVLFLLFKICEEFLTMRIVRDYDMNMLALNMVIHQYFYNTPSVRLFESPFKDFEISREILNHFPSDPNKKTITLFPAGTESHENVVYPHALTFSGPEPKYNTFLKSSEIFRDHSPDRKGNMSTSAINLSPGVAPGYDSHCNSEYVRTGFPLCSPFFTFDIHSKACFIHK